MGQRRQHLRRMDRGRLIDGDDPEPLRWWFGELA
jgi:hypothetical protein